jgi:hypothetical protein
MPTITAAAFAGVVLFHYGVSIIDILIFAAYAVLCLLLPGRLIVRAICTGGRRTFVEESALGFAVGSAVTLLLYVGARAADAPLLVLAWPIGTYMIFLLVPGLRRHWRKAVDDTPPPLWWCWSTALIIMCLVAWSAVSYFRVSGLGWPQMAHGYVDVPYHLALIGELRHHMPPTVPTVAGEPLLYHWFVHAYLAAASWSTGIDPVVLLLRLGMLPVLTALVVLIGLTGWRVIGSWAGSLVSLVAAVLAAVPNLYLGKNGLFSWGGILDVAWASPSQTFGALLFAAVFMVLAQLLRGGARGPGAWVVLGILLAALVGAKSTYAPLLVAGLTLLAVVGTIRRSTLRRPALLALAMTLAFLCYAQIVLFGSARQGVSIAPFSVAQNIWQGLTGEGGHENLPGVWLIGLGLLYLFACLIAWSGILGLLCQPASLIRADVLLILSMGGAAVGVALLLGSDHANQLYFLRGMYPYLAICAVLGLRVIKRWARVSRRQMAVAAGVGWIGAYLVPFLAGVQVPLTGDYLGIAIFAPYALLALLVMLALVVLRRVLSARPALALVLVAIAAIGLPAEIHDHVLSTASKIVAPRPARPSASHDLPAGVLEVGRWLRAHSAASDLVATNGHCRWVAGDFCDHRQFWVSAVTERRVLLEGWAYTAKNWDRWAPGQDAIFLPFWNEELLRQNDAAFVAPSHASIRLLRERYGVRWLFVDERWWPGRAAARIADFAELAFRSGDIALYRIPDVPVRLPSARPPRS